MTIEQLKQLEKKLRSAVYMADHLWQESTRSPFFTLTADPFDLPEQDQLAYRQRFETLDQAGIAGAEMHPYFLKDVKPLRPLSKHLISFSVRNRKELNIHLRGTSLLVYDSLLPFDQFLSLCIQVYVYIIFGLSEGEEQFIDWHLEIARRLQEKYLKTTPQATLKDVPIHCWLPHVNVYSAKDMLCFWILAMQSLFLLLEDPVLAGLVNEDRVDYLFTGKQCRESIQSGWSYIWHLALEVPDIPVSQIQIPERTIRKISLE